LGEALIDGLESIYRVSRGHSRIDERDTIINQAVGTCSAEHRHGPVVEDDVNVILA